MTLSREKWATIDPIMAGDETREGHVQSFIAGTVVAEENLFQDRVFSPRQDLPKSTAVFFVPVDKNPRYAHRVEDLRRSTDPYIFNTEWMLIPMSQSDAVFDVDDVDRASIVDYEYGPHLIDRNKVRILGIDWDKVTAATNLVVAQWNPATDVVEIIENEPAIESPSRTTITPPLCRPLRCRRSW
jgi:hypothetical protein